MYDPVLSVIGLVSVVVLGVYCLYKFVYSLIKIGVVLQGGESEE